MDSTINHPKSLRIIITGGSSGIGRAITLKMARSKHTNFLLLTAVNVAKVARLIIEQSDTSNIDHILLLPGVN